MEIDVNIRDIDFFSNKKISNYKVLSKSLGMLCIKIETKNNGTFVIKKNIKKTRNYAAVKYESKQGFSDPKKPVFRGLCGEAEC